MTAPKRQPKLFTRTYTPTPLGYLRWRSDKDPISKSTWIKWRSTILRLEELRCSHLEGAPWRELPEEDLGEGLWRVIRSECVGRNGAKPSSNTLRGRYDAVSSYYEFLIQICELDRNLLRTVKRPSARPKDRPFLGPTADRAVASVPKTGHQLAVYALARGCGLREGEIADIDDADVDFNDETIYVRKSKTDAARRGIPMTPIVKSLLLEYRNWRDANVSSASTRFVRTTSGCISKGFIWKLVKQIGAAANVPELTPHALRRTFGSALLHAGVQTAQFSPVMGHASPRVTEESYALAVREADARRAMVAAGEAPLAQALLTIDLGAQLEAAKEVVRTDAEVALGEARRIRMAAEALERSLLARCA